jgi:hypothetical protein
MQTETRRYHFIAYFFGGAFLANAIRGHGSDCLGLRDTYSYMYEKGTITCWDYFSARAIM